jgi:hypothetical protein
MNRYACNIMFEYEEKYVEGLIDYAIGNLGFSAAYMDIFFVGMRKSLDDVRFSTKELFKQLKPKPGVITIKQQLYDEDNRKTNNWVRLKLIFGAASGLNLFSMEWSNTNLNFLIGNSHFVKFLLTSEKLLYCYCYDQYDCMNQTNEQVNFFKENYPSAPIKVIKNYMGDDIIDVSQHWGRYLTTKGITFMAAPLMWFGQKCFKFIPKENLMRFGGISLGNSSTDLVHIKLFDLYGNPSDPENREMQRRFWEHLKLVELAKTV